ncbi:hypothetical protein [cyanobacterium endosymbiont of Epithemia clementina EcSB]|uniref:hypothetical protein n=1 Tax=cyanobacterium endosymbiont of Epithemia clementina EcSB TaxID=3034674 RepID=UPI0024801D71|nr:hypothetical protein [cyanobacterium endosymbiont of Epithemia clementina EcSB]WGT68549.1 hypothetical protein P3F56_03890 [cyanobacterium endosymbiont of Epithemia clementina EcSB]
MADSQSQPTETFKIKKPKFDFNKYAKRLNGRRTAIIFSNLTHRISDWSELVNLLGFTVNNHAKRKKFINSLPSRQVYTLISLRNFFKTCSVLV